MFVHPVGFGICIKNKNKLISDVRISKNVAYPDNLSKQKVSPALTLFSRELTTALQNKHGGQAKGIWLFLKILNHCILQPLLTASASKGLKVREAAVFTSPYDI